MTDIFTAKLAVQLGVLVGSAFVIYWFLWRPVMQRKESYYEFYKALDDVNATTFFKFRMLFKGLKQELWANALIILPMIAMALEWADAIPPFIKLPFLPEWAQPGSPGLLTAVGFITKYLNNMRSTPAGSPVPEAPTSIDVPTVQGAPDVVIVASASGGVENIIPKGQVVETAVSEPDEPDTTKRRKKPAKKKAKIKKRQKR